MAPLGNDRWQASFLVEQLGTYEYTVEGWIDRFTTWRTELGKKVAAGQSVTSELLEGAELVKQSASTAGGRAYADRLRSAVEEIGDQLRSAEDRVAAAMDAALLEAMSASPDRREATRYDRVLRVRVERERAALRRVVRDVPALGRHRSQPQRDVRGSRSAPADTSRRWASTSSTCRRSIRSARSFRKGPQQLAAGRPGRPRQPVGDRRRRPAATRRSSRRSARSRTSIGSSPPRRGTVSRSRSILRSSASPDHPWVREHPEWFRHRPDGTIKYAENPPKKYQDIYPINFECDAGKRSGTS